MQQQGLSAGAFQAIAEGGIDLGQPASLSLTALVLSNLVSNVPAVLLLEPVLTELNQPRLWYLLSLVSTWAGNLTLVGSIANLIVAESAAAFGIRLDLKTYCKAGVPLAVVTVLLGTVWIVLVM
jgi:Na+/H+ antiporter NhaD/arsenite permease-like protein